MPDLDEGKDPAAPLTGRRGTWRAERQDLARSNSRPIKINDLGMFHARGVAASVSVLALLAPALAPLALICAAKNWKICTLLRDHATSRDGEGPAPRHHFRQLTMDVRSGLSKTRIRAAGLALCARQAEAGAFTCKA
jgi:hypothetical protein